jgi:catechol 2,3-dioxygenase-like lactoylglutathione lyase family enzyme
MAKPKLRHLAIFTTRPRELAEFYRQVFDMEIVHTGHEPGYGDFVFVSDGYMNLALLPNKVDGDITVGLNHFGFVVDNIEEIRRRIGTMGLKLPEKRPSHRPYAEYRGTDGDGNLFDLSEHGYERTETGEEREKRKASA